LFTLITSCEKTIDTKIPVIIDADTANEVDDLYAIVRAVLAPELNLLGITAAQFHISPLASDSSVLESQHLNEEIVRLMNRSDIVLPIGSNVPLSASNQPAISEASTFIVEQAQKHTPAYPLNLVI